jgi:hypothetical protein
MSKLCLLLSPNKTKHKKGKSIAKTDDDEDEIASFLNQSIREPQTRKSNHKSISENVPINVSNQRKSRIMSTDHSKSQFPSKIPQINLLK